MFKKLIAVFLLAGLLFSGSYFAPAANAFQPPVDVLEEVLAETGAYLLKTLPNPRAGSGGSEWVVVGLARAGYEVPDWYASYYKALETELKEKKGSLHEQKYTEYSRVILALTAIGKDPADVGGYNLLAKLGDFEKVASQGINGPLFTLLALDTKDYAIPESAGAKVRTTRELLLEAIMKLQLPDGGFSLGGQVGDADITAMVLQALAPYRERVAVKEVTDKALFCLSGLQGSDGGYTGFWEAANLESDVQVLIALTALGIDPAADSRFTKNGKTVVDHLLGYAVPGGGFKHLPEQTRPDGMATEQAFYGLVAYDRFLKGRKGLYEMSDLQIPGEEQSPGPAGLPGKNPAVMVPPLCSPGKTFGDITGEKAGAAIETLASHGIINGIDDRAFEPGRTMTRAEFATIVVRALGLAPAAGTPFKDVASTSWYAAYVGAAYGYGIVYGTSETTFSPEGTLTREEAAVMVTRAAELCGLNTAMDTASSRDLLAQFPDYLTSSKWAREALAFCCREEILPTDVLHLEPQETITRAEVAAMIYRMLQRAALL